MQHGEGLLSFPGHLIGRPSSIEVGLKYIPDCSFLKELIVNTFAFEILVDQTATPLVHFFIVSLMQHQISFFLLNHKTIF